MAKATNGNVSPTRINRDGEASGKYLQPLQHCFLDVPVSESTGLGVANSRQQRLHRIFFNNLPEITDGKAATYNADPVPGRSNPLHTYSHSDNRTIGITFHFIVQSQEDIPRILQDIRVLRSCVYPQDSRGWSPFVPPVICKFKCGELISSKALCLIMQNYELTVPTDQVWDETTYCPQKIDFTSTWVVVYRSEQLPSQNRIIKIGV